MQRTNIFPQPHHIAPLVLTLCLLTSFSYGGQTEDLQASKSSTPPSPMASQAVGHTPENPQKAATGEISETLEALCQAIKASEGNVRLAACQVPKNQEITIEALKALLEATQDSEEMVRIEAEYVLRSLKIQNSELLLTLLSQIITEAQNPKLNPRNDTHWPIREAAAQALGDFEITEKLLIALLKAQFDNNLKVQDAAFKALGILKDKDLSKFITISFCLIRENNDSEVRRKAIEILDGLQAIHTENNQQKFLTILFVAMAKDSDSNVRTVASRTYDLYQRR